MKLQAKDLGVDLRDQLLRGVLPGQRLREVLEIIVSRTRECFY